jgi:hypothetical protein
MHLLEAAGEQEDFGEREPRRRYERRSERDSDTSDIAEDFKQGAKAGEALECREGTGAPCLKFRCAKPLHTASSYVF